MHKKESKMRRVLSAVKWAEQNGYQVADYAQNLHLRLNCLLNIKMTSMKKDLEHILRAAELSNNTSWLIWDNPGYWQYNIAVDKLPIKLNDWINF